MQTMNPETKTENKRKYGDFKVWFDLEQQEWVLEKIKSGSRTIYDPIGEVEDYRVVKHYPEQGSPDPMIEVGKILTGWLQQEAWNKRKD